MTHIAEAIQYRKLDRGVVDEARNYPLILDPSELDNATR